jgi:hypothetical protein
MTKRDKLINRFFNQPKDFTFDEMTRLFGYMGFELNEKGAGSCISFENDELELSYKMHKPHPEKVVKRYIIKQVLDFFIENQLI